MEACMSIIHSTEDTKLLGLETSKNVIIEHSKDGYGIGAALLAAANSKYEHDF
jgi:hexokinase